VRAIPFGLLDAAEVDTLDDTQWRDKALALVSNGSHGAGNANMPCSSCYEMKIPQDKVRILIGSKGSTIKEISQKSRCRIDLAKSESQAETEGGLVTVLIQPLPAPVPLDSAAKDGKVPVEPEVAGDVEVAVDLITEALDERARSSKQGLFPGAVLHVRVARIVEFGAFVALPPHGREGLVHISELSYDHIEAVTDVLDVDDEMYVVVMSVDERGRPRLSLKGMSLFCLTGVFYRNRLKCICMRSKEERNEGKNAQGIIG